MQTTSQKTRNGFTLIEMLIAIGIIVVLLGMVFLVGQGVLETSKIKGTQELLTQVNEAMRAFSQENPFKSVALAQERYGPFPPDDVLAYTATNGTDVVIPNLMPGGIGQFVVMLPADYQRLTDDYEDSDNYVANGDIKALCWGLRFNTSTRPMYEAIPARFKRSVPLDHEFFDADGDYDGLGGGAEEVQDQEVQYLVDGWGNPLQYFAVRHHQPAEPTPTPHAVVSRLLVLANKKVPVIMSYGPNGENQYAAGQTLAQLYNEGNSGDKVFSKAVNGDNIYMDAALGDKIADLKK